MTITLSDEDMRGEHRLRRALALIAVSIGLVLGLIAVAVYINEPLAFGLGLLYPLVMAVGFGMLHKTESDTTSAKDEGGWAMLVAVIAFIAFMAGGVAWHNLVLSSGRNVTAVVLTEKVDKSSRGSVTRSYTLDPQGTTDGIPGGNLQPDSERFKPGDVITVRVDPAGRVAPKLPGEADSPAALLTFLGCDALIAAVVLWAARKPRPPRAPGPTRRPLAERGRRARERFLALTGWPFAVTAAALSAAWLGLFRLALGNLTMTITAGVAYLFVMSGFFGMFDDDKAKDAFRSRAVLLTALATVAVGAYLCATT
ncbi:hypothetical protein ACWC9T_23345 [Kitasatospora sp. NPDC001159]